MTRTSARFLAAGLASVILASLAPAAHAAPAARSGADPGAVVSWIRDHARPAGSLPSGHPPHRMPAMRAITGDAVVVGLGVGAEGARELDGASRALTRYLVRRRGFRTIALEDDWTAGVLLNAYLRTGDGDLRGLVAQLAPRFRTPGMVRFVRWVRRYDQTHASDVRFVGLDATSTRALAYDAVTGYVADAAPGQLDELRGYYARIRPHTDDIWAYNDYFYDRVEHKEAYVRLAGEAYRLVAQLPVDHRSRDYRLALHDAYTIKAYYTIAALHPLGYRDKLMAHNLVWWRERTGDKVVALSAHAHMARDRDVTLSYPPHPTSTFAAAGSYLRDRYGDRYVPIALTFGGGSVTSGLARGNPRRYPVPPPAVGATEHLLGSTPWRCYFLDLGRPAPRAVRTWLSSPATLRAISMGSYDPARARQYFMGDGSLRQWFDAVVHVRHVTASHLMAPATR